jgi:hypothetical protein
MTRRKGGASCSFFIVSGLGRDGRVCSMKRKLGLEPYIRTKTMPIELTEQQQQCLDAADELPPRVVDPRTRTAYVLISAREYETVREILEDETEQRAIRKVATRNAVGRMDEEP